MPWCTIWVWKGTYLSQWTLSDSFLARLWNFISLIQPNPPIVAYLQWYCQGYWGPPVPMLLWKLNVIGMMRGSFCVSQWLYFLFLHGKAALYVRMISTQTWTDSRLCSDHCCSTSVSILLGHSMLNWRVWWSGEGLLAEAILFGACVGIKNC